MAVFISSQVNRYETHWPQKNRVAPAFLFAHPYLVYPLFNFFLKSSNLSGSFAIPANLSMSSGARASSEITSTIARKPVAASLFLASIKPLTRVNNATFSSSPISAAMAGTIIIIIAAPAIGLLDASGMSEASPFRSSKGCSVPKINLFGLTLSAEQISLISRAPGLVRPASYPKSTVLDMPVTRPNSLMLKPCSSRAFFISKAIGSFPSIGTGVDCLALSGMGVFSVLSRCQKP